MTRSSRLPRITLVASVAVALVAMVVAPGRWSAAQEPSGLVGDYAVSIGSNDIPPDLAGGSLLVGRWHVAFQADGSYYAERLDIGRVVSGSYEVDGETLTVTDEEGLVSCANATAATGDQFDVATGSYSVAVDEDILVLTRAEDECRTRAILFGTRDFTQFVACLTNAPAATPVASPVEDGASPVAEDEEGLADEREGPNDGGLFDLLTPTTGGAGDDEGDADEEDAEEAADPDANVDQEIDDLLAQLTACWSTQDAEQFLPLLSEGFAEVFLGAGEVEELRMMLEELMIQPFTWERAGEIELSGDDEATVVVRLSIAGADQFLTYRFVLGDDGWRWDGEEV